MTLRQGISKGHMLRSCQAASRSLLQSDKTRTTKLSNRLINS